jgi:hypothetical protein
VEDTAEHRDLFGEEFSAVAYFDSSQALAEKARLLVADEGLRASMAEASRRIVIRGGHTYRDRLRLMLGLGAERTVATPGTTSTRSA